MNPLTIEEKIADLGYTLPPPPAPAGNYLPARRAGNLLYLAGTICIRDGKMTHTGKVGKEQTIESGYEAAQVCTLNALAAIKGELGSLDAVDHVVMVNGFVNGVEGFADSPKVINGASDLLVEIFGDRGKHARAAVSVSGLPLDTTVEVQIVVAVK